MGNNIMLIVFKWEYAFKIMYFKVCSISNYLWRLIVEETYLFGKSYTGL